MRDKLYVTHRAVIAAATAAAAASGPRLFIKDSDPIPFLLHSFVIVTKRLPTYTRTD